MSNRFSTNFTVFSLFNDLAIIVATLFLEDFAFNKKRLLYPFFGDYGLPWELFLIIPIVWVVFGALYSLYDEKRNIRVVDELTSFTICTLLTMVVTAGILYLSFRDVSRKLFLLSFFMIYIFLIVGRLLFRRLYHDYYWKRDNFRKVLIIGAGIVGQEVKKQLDGYDDRTIKFVGFLDDDIQKKTQQDVLGTIETMRAQVHETQVTDVVVALPIRAYETMEKIVLELSDLPVNVWIIPDYFQWALYHVDIVKFAGIPMIDLRAPAIDNYQRFIKRAFDLILAIIILIPIFPLMCIISILILLFDGRPVLYLQNRVGENGQIFKMYKFRTMVPKAETMFKEISSFDPEGNAIYKQRDDPRVTRVGRFLRRFSLDELPQLFNILEGSMSFVGPRPELPELVQKYQPWQRKRFCVPQGLTGWWQINGRSDKPMHLHTEEDLYYIQNYSFWLDIKILLKTVWVVLRGKGAY